MKRRKGFTLIELLVVVAIVAMLIGLLVQLVGCDEISPPTPKSSSGVKKATVKVTTQANGLTVEQQNVKDRLTLEGKPGAIKHLYIMSAYSGQAIVYSTVKGKVTSSGKRLTPLTVSCMEGQYVRSDHEGMAVRIGNNTYRTAEVLQDDGTYGNSIPYLYWWDSKGIYHQHYINGGQIVHISDQPIAMKNIIINMEVAK